jgi:uncharacterized membrane protein
MKRHVLTRDRRGSVTLMTTAAMLTLLCFAGLVIDVGDIFDAHRRLQGTSDLAVIAAASDLQNASAAAAAVAGDNYYPTGAVTSVVTGVYTNNPLVPPAKRFSAAPAAAANAAQVTMSAPQALFFNGAFNLAGGAGASTRPLVPNTAEVGAQSIAVNTVAASFTVGSGLAQLNGGLINSVLGGLLGGNLSLSVMDYQSLLSTQVDLFQFSNALATDLNLTGITYNQLLSGTVTLGQVVQALQLAGAGGAAAGALNEIAAAVGNSTEQLNLSQLINFGPFQYYQVGSAEVTPVSVSVYQLLTLAGQLAGGGHQIALSLNAGIPGIAGATGIMTVGEPPVNSSMITVGNTNTSVHTAQTRLFLNVSLGAPTGFTYVQLPLYLELASATATLSTLSCNVLDPTSSSVTLAVSPAVANGWIANVSPSAMVDYTREPTPGPATLAGVSLGPLGIASITGYANFPIGNPPANLVFTYADIQNDVMQATSTTDYFASLFGGLLGKLSLSANILGVPIGLPPAAATLGTTLAAAATPVDTLVSGVLQTVGVNVGVADTWVTGVHCAPAMLAQ